MTVIVRAALIAAALFFGVLLFLEVGRRWDMHGLASDPERARLGTGAVERAVFGLLGLLIAFTFAGAANRFDIKRDLIVVETNAIGTSWLRLDLLHLRRLITLLGIDVAGHIDRRRTQRKGAGADRDDEEKRHL